MVAAEALRRHQLEECLAESEPYPIPIHAFTHDVSALKLTFRHLGLKNRLIA